MRRMHAAIGLAAVLAVTAAVPARSQENVTDLLSGRAAPLTMKLKDMTGDWRRMTVGGQSELDNLLQTFTSLFGSLSGHTYYTTGRTVQIGGDTYLVAYKVKGPSLSSLMQGAGGGLGGGVPGLPGANAPAPGAPGAPPAPGENASPIPKLTPDTDLALSLLNMRSVGSLTDIRPFNMQEEISESEAASSALGMLGMLGSMIGSKAMEQGMGGGAATPKVTPKPAPKKPAPRKK